MLSPKKTELQTLVENEYALNDRVQIYMQNKRGNGESRNSS